MTEIDRQKLSKSLKNMMNQKTLIFYEFSLGKLINQQNLITQKVSNYHKNKAKQNHINEIKQKNLRTSKNCYDVDRQEIYQLEKQQNLLQIPQYKFGSHYQQSTKEIERQREAQVYKQKQDLFRLKQSINQQTHQYNYEQQEFFRVPMSLINSVYQLGQITYEESQNDQLVYSFKNDIINERRSYNKVTVINEEMQLILGQLDPQQKILYNMFNTSQKFIFEFFREEIQLQIKVIPCRITMGIYGHYFREDKCVFEAVLKAKFQKPNQNNLKKDDSFQNQSQEKTYGFEFLNKIEEHGLDKLPSPPLIQNISKQNQRKLNIFYIFREIIFNSLDYLHCKFCGNQVLYQPERIPSSMFSDSQEDPSLKLKKLYSGIKVNKVPKEQEIEQRNIVMRNLEKKIKILSYRIQKNRKFSVATNMFLSPDQAIDKYIRLFSKDADQSANKFQLKLQSEISTKIAAEDEKPRKFLADIKNKGVFFKRKGKTNIYHQCWLELRGFHLAWYHNQKDKNARGIELLDEAAIIDEGLQGTERIYHVKLMSRSITFKVDQSKVGNQWRRIIANQIAYKTYLNGMMFSNRISCSYNKQILKRDQQADNVNIIDESSLIKSRLIDYFTNESCHILDISNDGLELLLPVVVFRGNLPKLHNYTTQLGRILGDSLLSHNKLKEINMSSSMCGHSFINQMLLAMQDKRINMRISKLDLSSNVMNQQSILSLTSFLLSENSFQLTQLYMNDVNIGDQLFETLLQGINQRYKLYWDKPYIDQNEQKQINQSPLKQQKSIRKQEILSIENIGISDRGISQLMASIDTIITQVLLSLKNKSQLMVKTEQTINFGLSTDLNQLAMELKVQMGIITLDMLNTLQGVMKAQEYNEWGEEIILKLISFDLNISYNNCGDGSLTAISKLIKKYDCFRSLRMVELKESSGLGLQSFTKSIVNSLNLQFIDISKNNLDVQQILSIMHLMGDNFSIKTLKLSLQDFYKKEFTKQLQESRNSRILSKCLQIENFYD